jgi:predicted amidohydrolase YtcJ
MTDGFHIDDRDAGLLVTADRIHSMDPATGTAASALAILDGRIAAVGEPASLRRRFPHARRLDLPGAVLTPGLTDAHIHVTEWAFALAQADLSAAHTPQHAARLLADHAASRRERGEWVLGRGWNANLWQGAVPHRSLLDDVVPDAPAALQSHDMHALWVNSAALAAAGITAATPDPDGGHIQRDATGEPTGLLLEWAGRLVTRLLPLPDTARAADIVATAIPALHALGITGVHSYPGVHFPDPDPLPVLLLLREQRRLRLRVLQHIRVERLDHAISIGLRSGFGDEWLRIGAVKMFLDGALGSRTAWMREPYEDAPGTGMNTLPADEFAGHVRRAAAAGIATTVHAIGDAAVCLALDVLADPALRVQALPHRIEHVQCCPVDRLGDAAAAGITCSMQPCHLMTDWRIADAAWGSRRSRGAFALGSLLRHGSLLAFGSDAPVEPVDPRRSLFAAVRRQDEAMQPEGGWFPDECIDAVAALRGFTVGPAAAAGLPHPWGTLAPGAPADIAAWDADPLGDPGRLLSMRCVAALVGGEVVHAT